MSKHLSAYSFFFEEVEFAYRLHYPLRYKSESWEHRQRRSFCRAYRNACKKMSGTEPYWIHEGSHRSKCSTAVFPKVAVPHAVCDSASKTSIVVGISHDGIEFEPLESADQANPVVNVIFQIVFERENTGSHLNVLRDILYIVSKPEFYEKILGVKIGRAEWRT